ncbi:MAG TPA: hypothetical protein VGK19_25700 [Capsulimonadaceae bacterium]|jgi:hypothetical protein
MSEAVNDDAQVDTPPESHDAKADAVDKAAIERRVNLAIAAVLAYVAYSVFIPFIPLPHLPRHALQLYASVATLVTTLLFMFLQLWMPRMVVALRPRPLQAAGVVLICVAAWLLANAFLHPYRGLARESNHTLFILRAATMGALLTLGLTYLGTILSRIIREVNVLLPVAFVAMPIDYIGAMTPTGYTADMVKNHPDVVKNVSVSVPVMHGVTPIGFIGPGDVLFIAFFLAVALNLRLNEKGTFKLMYVMLTATMIFVTMTGINVAALVPMGCAVLIANFRHFKLQRSEVFASLYAMALVLVLVVAFYLYSHRHFFGGK